MKNLKKINNLVASNPVAALGLNSVTTIKKQSTLYTKQLTYMSELPENVLTERYDEENNEDINDYEENVHYMDSIDEGPGARFMVKKAAKSDLKFGLIMPKERHTNTNLLSKRNTYNTNNSRLNNSNLNNLSHASYVADITYATLLASRELKLNQFLMHSKLKRIAERNGEYKIKYKRRFKHLVEEKELDIEEGGVKVKKKNTSALMKYQNKGNDTKKKKNTKEAHSQTDVNQNHIDTLSKEKFIDTFKLEIFKFDNTMKRMNDIFQEIITNVDLLKKYTRDKEKHSSFNDSNDEKDKEDELVSLNDNSYDDFENREYIMEKIERLINDGIKIINGINSEEIKINEMLKALLNDNNNLLNENESLKESVEKLQMINENTKEVFNEVYDSLLNSNNENTIKLEKFFQSYPELNPKVISFVQNYIKSNKDRSKKEKIQITKLITRINYKVTENIAKLVPDIIKENSNYINSRKLLEEYYLINNIKTDYEKITNLSYYFDINCFFWNYSK